MKDWSKTARAPFLRRAYLSKPQKRPTEFPFVIPSIARGFDLKFDKPVTMFVGENGSGKSTLLEAIASECGFSLRGGSRNHHLGQEKTALSANMKFEWLPKMGEGFFLRAESFFDFSNQIDEIAKIDPVILSSYGGTSLHDQSHGESFLALFNNRIGGTGIYLLDEPEAALSPARQLALLRIIHDMVKEGRAQFIIATHSPILLSLPGAKLLSFTEKGIEPIAYKDTDHYQITKSFLENPERYFKSLFSDE